ncbi:hypothetical protein BKA65DRAFT_513057 [Rhexocercosporidium sp. MPI-PUGE-AT-0058]|nr:hypothetical protein BKA65DRAFT_513057 [Rhexocercosporidium sp. MPI-PUGE-AT-0058]
MWWPRLCLDSLFALLNWIPHTSVLDEDNQCHTAQGPLSLHQPTSHLSTVSFHTLLLIFQCNTSTIVSSILI